jgi:GT2 family glycosyltransferase
MAQPYILTVILNTNRRDDTLECLRSLNKSIYPNLDTMVLDNASSDGSVEAIRQDFPEVEIVPLTENRGYAGNNNIGIRRAVEQGADWVFVLNEDTVLDPECITHLAEAVDGDPQCGIAGPMVYHFDAPEVIQSAGGRFDSHLNSIHIGQNEVDRGQYAHTRQVDWISGCAILVRREVIEAVDALDERFFYYWEETEWCLRASKNGWHILHVPEARLWHKGVQQDYSPAPSVTYYNTRNRLLMLSKHGAPFSTWFYTWGKTMGTLRSWTFKPQWRHMQPHRDALWMGMRDFLKRRWGSMPR